MKNPNPPLKLVFYKTPLGTEPVREWLKGLSREDNMTTNKTIGSTFDSFLEEEGILAEVTATATKRVLAFQFAQAMKKKRLSKVMLATKMRTSRSALDRLLDPENRSVTLLTLERAAAVLGKKLKVSLV